MILRKLASPMPRHHVYADLDPVLPSPSMSPRPASPTSHSKTTAFFASPFTTPPSSPTRPLTPAKDASKGDVSNGNVKKPTRSLTADFFSSPSPTPPVPVPSKNAPKRSFLNLDLLHLDGLASLAPAAPAPFTLTPTPTSEFPPDLSSEPTPRPPGLTLKASHPPPSSSPLFKFESLASPLQIASPCSVSPPQYLAEPPPGTREDAEVLPSSSRYSDHGHGQDEEEGELVPGMIIRSFLPGHTSNPPLSPVSTSPSFSTISSSSSSTLFPPSESSWSTTNSSHEHGGDVSLLLSRALGSGAFSNVWLAEDLSPTPLLLKTKRSLRDLKQKSIKGGKLKEARSSSSLMRKLRGGISGTRPHGNSSPGKKYGGLGLGVPNGIEFETDRVSSSSSVRSVYLDEKDGDGDMGSSLSRNSSISWKSQSSESGGGVSRNGSTRSRNGGKPKLVAVKLTLRGSIENNTRRRGEADDSERDRMRVSFVREVEVLRHISHPNITPLLSHLTTRTHHLLVLPYCSGGDLLGLVGSDLWHDLTEDVVRRIWMELCRAVGWMHGVGLVHRDVKLENILLTVPLTEPLPLSPLPLIQLTDFGLSRFIDPSAPLLATRCGSEAYAAPELVINGGRSAVASGPSKWGAYDHDDSGGYDGRETDAWACGVALYELATRSLPFGDGPGGKRGGQGREGGPHERRQWLMRIAQAKWRWPEVRQGEETRLVASSDIRRMVERLLVRNPSRRSRIIDLWEDEWIRVDEEERERREPEDESSGVRVNVWRSSQRFEDLRPDDDEALDAEEEALENEVDEDGWIVDGDRIEDIARQEVQ